MKNINDESKKVRRTIKILVGFIIFLLIFILFSFIIKPQFDKYVYEKQMEGANFAISGIVIGVQNNGYVEIPLSSNQSLVLVPYVPSQGQGMA
jgi:hypothetical protein